MEYFWSKVRAWCLSPTTFQSVLVANFSACELSVCICTHAIYFHVLSLCIHFHPPSHTTSPSYSAGVLREREYYFEALSSTGAKSLFLCRSHYCYYNQTECVPHTWKCVILAHGGRNTALEKCWGFSTLCAVQIKNVEFVHRWLVDELFLVDWKSIIFTANYACDCTLVQD